MLVSGAVIGIGVASLGTVGLAQAATNSETSTDPQQSLVEKLATTFKLNKDDVQKVFDQEHSEREAERQQQITDKLNALVKDGKITQDQADKLSAKAKELQAQHQTNRESMKDKTKEERKAAMEAERNDLKKWLSDNGISEEYARIIVGMGHGPGGHGHHGPLGDMDDSLTN